MTIRVAKFLDVADGLQPKQFSVGEHDEIESLDELDPIYRQLLDEPVAVRARAHRRRRAANLTPMWFDYDGDRSWSTWPRTARRSTGSARTRDSRSCSSTRRTRTTGSASSARVGRGDLRGRSRSRAARHRAPRQDLDEVHAAAPPVRAARSVDRRAAGAVRVPRSIRSPPSASPDAMAYGWRIAVVGGSLGGLTAGALLADLGIDVDDLRALARRARRARRRHRLPARPPTATSSSAPASTLDEISVAHRPHPLPGPRRRRRARRAHTLPVQLVEHRVPADARLLRPRRATGSATR